MKLLKGLILAGAVGSAHAGGWDSDDTLRESLWQGVNVVDYGQTLDIAGKCGYTSIHERNPLLPRCPTRKQVHKHFIIGAALHFGISYALPKKYRVGFQWVSIGLGVQIVHSNVRLGLDIKF